MSERGKKFISIIREGNVVRSLVLRDSLLYHGTEFRGKRKGETTVSERKLGKRNIVHY